MLNPEQKLLAGIHEEALQEAEAIVEQAQIAADKRRVAAAQQVERITREAEEQLREQIETIQRTRESNIAVAGRRISLRMRNDLIRTVTEMVQEEFSRMVSLPEYREVLRGWIVEAVLGLGGFPEGGSAVNDSVAESSKAHASAAEVNASAAELPLINSELLREAESKVKEICGRSVTLNKSGGDPLSAQGVVITSRDGRVAFNNQVRTRLLRSQTEINRLIHSLDSNSKSGAG